MVTKANIVALVGTGVALGVAHVLTGPDHLSAIATLSANESNCSKSFWLGARWGIGHSTGLLVVGIALIIYDFHQQQRQSKNYNDDDEAVLEVPDVLSHFFESLVGVFMICLGLYGLRRAMIQRHEYQGRIELSDPIHDDNNNNASTTYHQDHNHTYFHLYSNCETNETGADITSTYQYMGTMSFTDMVVDSVEQQELNDESELHRQEQSNTIVSDSDSQEDNQTTHTTSSKFCPRNIEVSACHDCCNIWVQWSQQFSAQTLAIGIGLIHGLAGPGGVLGVIPAVQLHDWLLATIYLTSFCISSTLTMGCYACLYGTLSFRFGKGANLEYQVQLVSAGLSLLVGITWLVLLALGKLEDVFP